MRSILTCKLSTEVAYSAARAALHEYFINNLRIKFYANDNDPRRRVFGPNFKSTLLRLCLCLWTLYVLLEDGTRMAPLVRAHVGWKAKKRSRREKKTQEGRCRKISTPNNALSALRGHNDDVCSTTWPITKWGVAMLYIIYLG